jgi:hypothetical protein
LRAETFTKALHDENEDVKVKRHNSGDYVDPAPCAYPLFWRALSYAGTARGGGAEAEAAKIRAMSYEAAIDELFKRMRSSRSA